MTIYPMTNALHSALNSLSESDRRVLRRVIAEMDPATTLGRVLAGVATELVVLDLAEAEALQAFKRDHQADMDVLDAAHPYPAATGPAMFVDPGE